VVMPSCVSKLLKNAESQEMSSAQENNPWTTIFLPTIFGNLHSPPYA
jgi:hypothetical protein